MMSFILIGFGKQTRRDLGETGDEMQCPWCSNIIFNHLILVRTWLTCFFIPIIPYRSEYLIMCPACAKGVVIYGEEIKAAKRGELRIRSDEAIAKNE
jgi:hypothetical protein